MRKTSEIENRTSETGQQLFNYIYSHHNVEKKVFGHIVETEDRVYLYEYRGKYIGSEFFIAFTKDSVSYKLVSKDAGP